MSKAPVDAIYRAAAQTDHWSGDAVDLKMPPQDPAQLKFYEAVGLEQLKFYEAVARAYGLTVTSGANATQPKEQKMPPTNPYDRRDRARARGPRADHEYELAVAADGQAPRQRDVARDRLEMADEVDTPGLTLADLEFLIKRKVQKARRDGDDAAYQRELAERNAAMRVAWDEGADAGARDRGEALHAAFEQAFGAKVHDLHQRAVAILDAAPEGEKPTTAEGRALRTVEHLLELVRDVAKVTDEAIAKHDRELRHMAQTGHTNLEIPF